MAPPPPEVVRLRQAVQNLEMNEKKYLEDIQAGPTEQAQAEQN